MMHLTNKFCRYIWISLYTLLTVLLGLIIALSITGPQNNLLPLQMAAGTVWGTLLLLVSFFLWDKIPCPKIKQSSLLYIALLLLFGVLLYVISCFGRNAVYSLEDYDHIWTTALELAENRDMSREYYFMIYANNIKPALYLSVLFRIAYFFHFSDPFYFILLLSVLEILGAVWSVGILAGNTAQDRAVFRIPILFMFVFTLPIWANVQAFYTDSMSFVMGIMALAFIKLCLESHSWLRIGLLLVSAGILTGVGMSIKITVLIPIIAGFIVFCFSRPSLSGWKLIGAFFLCTVFIYESTSLWASTFAIWNTAKETSEPIIDWIALGMKDDGSYINNRDYAYYVTSLPTKQEKVEYTLHYIWENRSAFWDLSHLTLKIRNNFANGHLGASDFAYHPLKERNIIWNLFSPFGKQYWRISQLCFCYIFAIYSCYVLGAIATFHSLIRKRDIPAVKAIADLSLTGIIIFLMIWESNNRQLYNQIPVIILGAVMNIRQIIEAKKHFRIR